MTTEELKKKIDGLMFGLHSTNPKDINALPEILDAIIDAIEAIPAPTPQVQADWAQADSEEVDYIKHKPAIISALSLSQAPSEAMTTQAQLDAIGLTKAQIQKAAEGGFSAILAEGNLYNITRAYYRSQNNYGISFFYFIISGDGTFSRAFGYTVSMYDGDVTVEETDA